MRDEDGDEVDGLDEGNCEVVFYVVLSSET